MRKIATLGPFTIGLLLVAGPAIAQDGASQPEDMVETETPAETLDAPTLDQPEPSTQDRVPPPTIDTDGDGKADGWDRDGDGRADVWDSDGDGQPDLVDDDGDGKPDPR